MSDYMAYREELLQDIAVKLGKERNELVPWTDYDPITIDETAFKLAKNSNWAGD